MAIWCCVRCRAAEAACGPAALVARLSGDEFAIAFCCADTAENVAGYAERIRRAFEEPVLAAGRPHRVKVSIGAAVFPAGGRTADELLSNSHIAFYRAKAIKRGGYVAFENSIRQEMERASRWRPNSCAPRRWSELFFRPGSISATKSWSAPRRSRWRHPVRGLVPPALHVRGQPPPGISDGSLIGCCRPPAGRLGLGARGPSCASASTCRRRSCSRRPRQQVARCSRQPVSRRS
jgi:predicted signal transduction protein with EAL and GGDEF domain